MVNALANVLIANFPGRLAEGSQTVCSFSQGAKAHASVSSCHRFCRGSLFAGSASAADNGFYFGGSIGLSDFSSALDETFDSEDTGFKIVAGAVLSICLAPSELHRPR